MGYQQPHRQERRLQGECTRITIKKETKVSTMSLLQESSEEDVYMNCFYKGCRHVLSFYNSPPVTGEIGLRNIQEITAKRLAMLQYIDARSDIKIKSLKVKENEQHKLDQKTNERIMEIEEKMVELGFMLPKVLYSREDFKEYIHIAQTDVISHFLLKMAFSMDKERSEWLIRNESRLFDIRLERLRSIKIQEVDGVDKLESFLQNQGIYYENIKNPTLNTRYMNKDAQEFNDLIKFRTDFAFINKLYVVPFYPDASQLVKARLVTIRDSIAYVPPSSLFIVISTRFKICLQQSLRFLSENSQILNTQVLSDERLSGFLKVLPESYLVTDYSKFNVTEENRLSLANINQIYKVTFPPCMRRIFSQYLKSGHMKHWGRQQLWLFLKGAGLTLEESMNLNRTIWSDSNNFEKEHGYNIRHLYGKEGRRANYPPYSCGRILSKLPSNVGGSIHGCPFKELDNKGLYSLLQEFGLTSKQAAPIVDLKATHQYQLACVEYFNQTTPNGCADGIGTHPNIFFQASFKARFGKQEEKDIEQV
ncbi:DNA primase large subunit, putative [Theileria equi strain WA]|uniref:DNA primase large subunit, putative n=1 Tax=Theileria equi strain WA TaxID=1537102 RepID=L1LCD3_THEEQ|nr:DNA primase large subunit, putative [Theileria equi strain WA]EKX72808.1 DNA primase large subunit, putative [Theileria equi strain WA]|eukprot:XP_004832260.1 DNA primase large subunit, putative [Theileria equi strain WA]